MKKFIFLLTLTVVTSGVFAVEPGFDADKADPASLVGLVTDRVSGESLTGVKVKVEGLDLVTYTDFDGVFKFDHLSPGDYTVQVEFISYDGEKIEKISIDRNTVRRLDVKLRPSTVSLESGHL
jgi:hypothetical protein